MLRRTVFLLFLPLLLVFSRPALAQESWVIESFDSRISIFQNGRVQVVETIAVDFGTVAKHGIFRTIPTEGIRLNLKEVKQDGQKAIVKTTTSGGEFSIRIGDPNRTITGRHFYEISYEAGKVITRFEDHDEFYWNVTGTGWGVPIRRAAATVFLEGGDILQTACFTGRLGSQVQNCAAAVVAARGEFSTTGGLAVGEGLTIANAFPKGIVQDPFYLDELIRPYWLVLGSLAAVGYVVRRWWNHGRDLWYKGQVVDNPNAVEGIKPLFARQTVVVEFEPPAFASSELRKGGALPLRPGEVGVLVDERADIHDISATIVDLAVRGYLQIHETKEGRRARYHFEQKKEFLNDPELAEWEREVLRGIFGSEGGGGEKVALTDLQENFYTRLGTIRKELYSQLAEGGYFPQPPHEVTAKYLARGGVLGAAAGALFYIFNGIGLWWVPVPLAVLAGLTLISAPLMPRKTAKGSEAVRRASGFKLFIATAQKYQQQFNERINRFDEFLPYAMVFGVVDKWVGTFKALGVEPPQPRWYVGPGPFRVGTFSSTVNAMESSFSSTLPSTPASKGGSGFGGGGFSGGGFGGGGGGSW